MTDDIELKPCPFCGGKAVYYYQRDNEAIFCDECGAKLPYLDFGEAHDKLAKQWNARPFEDALRAKNKRLREVLERISDEFEKDEINSFQINRWIYEVLKGTEEK